MKNTFVSVIIPNFNNQDRLDLCLAALMQQTYPREQMEVILVDNGSTDASIEISKKYPIQILIQTEYQSPYCCRNAGIKQAKGSIIALLDSNCVPKASWLASGVYQLQHSTASIVTGPIHFNFSPQKSIAERIDYLYSVVTAEDLPRVSALPGGHLFIPKVLFDQIGYFIPHIRSLGDIEWTQRATSQGYTFGFADNAIVDYPSKNFMAAMRKMIRLGGGQKELWLAAGKSVSALPWILRIGKNLLPPSPLFYREMAARNKEENMGVSSVPLYLGLYFIKLCYAWGMTFKKTSAQIAHIL